MKWVYDDGGRSKYFQGEAGDCVCRAIAIATGKDYKEVYRSLAQYNKKRYGKRSARNGIARDDIKAYMAEIGWEWHPTMGIGTGCKVHLDESELPGGAIVCSLSRHLAAVLDGVLHDTYDSGRGGTRCVYGYWSKPKEKPKPISGDRFAAMIDAYKEDFEAGYMSPQEFGRLCADAARLRAGK